MHADNKPLKSSRPVLASLAAFLRAGLRPRSALARAIVTVLVIKLIAVLGMTTYQHYADRRAEADAAGVALRLGPSSKP